MSYTIEKDVPIPDEIIRPKRGTYPLGEMEPGDSFFVSHETLKKNHPTAKDPVHSLAGAGHSFGKRNGKKFVVRRQDRGARIWRIK